ncbi:MAG TPA: hypothetical protein VES36_10980 [Candidatus Limnocylindrales bacterium]|nr:hypothetical protein [Candidatus Limnocylindrales bacterium]
MGQSRRVELHALRLGKLLGTLQLIEMDARLAIVTRDGHEVGQVRAQLPTVSVGDSVELNALTNPDSLGKTLVQYNERVPPEWRVDVEQIVFVRDALGHGRLFTFGSVRPDAALRLMKFSQAVTDGMVTVTMSIDMTEAWFNERIAFLGDALKRVRQALAWLKADSC